MRTSFQPLIDAVEWTGQTNGLRQVAGTGGEAFQGRQHPILTNSLSAPGVRLWSHFSPGTGEGQEVGLRLQVLLGVELPQTMHISKEGAGGPGRSPVSSLHG